MNNIFGELTWSLAQSVTRRAALKKFGAGLAAMAIAGFLLGQGSAQTYDAVADFSTDSNPNGVWSYRYTIGGSRDGNYALLPAYGPLPGFDGFDRIGGWAVNSYDPIVGVNQTGVPLAWGGFGFIWPAGAMLVHPGEAGPVVVSWQSPSDMLVDIAFSFADLDGNGGNGIAWFVERNDSTATLASGVVPNGVDSGARALNQVPVQAGDRINFIVDPRGDYAFDSTQFTARISTVSAPISPQTYDAVADFSTDSNPNGVWSYRYTTTTSRDGNYALLPAYSPDPGFDPIESWELNGYVPAVGVNQTGVPVAWRGLGPIWPAGAMRVHPGDAGLVVVSWQSPSSMLVDIAFSFADLHGGACGDGIAWFVERNDSTATLASGVVPDGGGSGPQALDQVPVQVGDRINFIVDPQGNNGCDSTQFTAAITTVPGSIVGPTLRIRPSGDAAIVWWSTNSPDFLLETASGPGADQHWTRWNGPVLSIGDQNVVTAGATSERRFFRLRKQ